MRHLPFQSSPALLTKRDEFDKIGTELWNLSTRLRRDKPAQDRKAKDTKTHNNNTICLLRAFAFLLIDSAGSHAVRSQEPKSCIRLMKVALKAAKVCISAKEFDSATKVLERAAIYEDILKAEGNDELGAEVELARRLRLEYFTIRTVLVSHISNTL